jgi:predicted permease
VNEFRRGPGAGAPGGSSGPPGFARRLLEFALPADERQSISGDLLEVFRRECAVRGRMRADLWYWGQALSFSGWFMRERMRENLASRRAEGSTEHWNGAAFGGGWPGGRRRNLGWRVGRMLDGWGRDLSQAVRSLLRAPAFTVITVGTLALAIGANTAIFSVINTVLLDPLAFPEPDRLVSISASAPGSDLPEEFGVGTEFYVQYRENASLLEDVGLYDAGQTTISANEHVERLFGSSASPSLFSTLGVTPILGRLPTNDDPEGQVGVISHWLWTQWFGRDPGVLDQTIEVSGNPVTIVGVMGPDFAFPEERISLWAHDLPTEPIRPGGFGLGLVGRLAPGADIDGLTAQLATLAQRLPERFGGPPQYQQIISQHRPIVRSLEEQLVGDIATPLWILLGTVGIVLLIACANVANLLIVRAESRRLDLAVRRALGAGRGSLIRSQMSEAIILSLAGGIAGVAIAWAGVPLLVRAAPESIPRLATAGLNTTALLFTAGVVIVAAFASGMLPAVRFSNPGLSGGLRHSHRVGAGPDHYTRDALVVVQTAAALVLLVGSGLLLKSFMELRRVDPGYDTQNIFTFQTAPDPRTHGLTDAVTFAQFHYEFMDRLAAMPGVESVGLANTLPLDEGAGLAQFATEQTAGDEAGQPMLRFTMVGGDYFQTMGIELLNGRDFERRATPIADPGIIVSQATADLLWPGGNAVGKRMGRAGDPRGMMTVIGVVEDIYLEDFRQESKDPMVYIPMVGRAAQGDWGVGTPAYVMRTERADIIAADVREVIREFAPDAPMYRIFTMDRLASRTMADLSFTMLTLAIAAGLALLLGAVGLYGVLSYIVAQRTREIGIRMALGAQASELRRMVVAQGGKVALIGVAIGIAGAVLATRVLNTLLFGVRAMDVVTFTAMSALMLAVALIASYIPARRASAVDPMQSLRTE